MCEICSKLTIKAPERHQGRRSGVFIVGFEHIFSGISRGFGIPGWAPKLCAQIKEKLM